MKKLIILSVLIAVVFMNEALARDFAGAAQTYSSTAKTIVQSASLGGVFLGGGAFAVPGLNRYAPSILKGGIIATFISYGAPAIVSLAQTIFGGA